MQLIGQPVKHNAFGKGIVTDLSSQMVTVQFSEGEKKFLYPQAFSSFLTLKNTDAQKAINDAYHQMLRAEKVQNQKKNAESERRCRLRTMKLSANDQIAFDLAEESVQDVFSRGRIFMGEYLSGSTKGQPRQVTRLKPNSAVLLTQLPASGKEADRQITGIFMVPETFWGTQHQDGYVPVHQRFQLALSPALALPYWDYVPSGKRVDRWGKIPFKYFSTRSTRDILRDIIVKLDPADPSGEQEQIQAFLQYFCTLNRLPEVRRI